MVAQPPPFSCSPSFVQDCCWIRRPVCPKGLLHCPLTAIMAATIRRGSPYYPRQWSHVRFYWR
jgi:hypothetical protein